MYLKGRHCFVSANFVISQQNAHRKKYEEKLKNKVNKVNDMPKDGMVSKYGHMIYEFDSHLVRLCFWNYNCYPWNM